HGRGRPLDVRDVENTAPLLEAGLGMSEHRQRHDDHDTDASEHREHRSPTVESGGGPLTRLHSGTRRHEDHFVASYFRPLSIGVAPLPWSCGTPTLTVWLTQPTPSGVVAV